MSGLEARYREALRWYPRSWRDANADALVGTLLDAAESEGREAPNRSDLTNLAVSGIRTRFDTIAGPRVRGIVATNALATGVAFSLTQFFTTSWAPLAEAHHLGIGDRIFGPFLDLGPILTGLWLLALIGAVLHRAALTRSASAALVLVVVAMEVVRNVHYTSGSISQYALLFNAGLGLASLVGSPRDRRSLVLLLAGWFAVFAVIDFSNGVYLTQASIYLWALGPANAAGLTMALASTCLIAAAIANIRQPETAVVILLSSVPWLLMWGAEIVTNPVDYFEFPFPLYGAGLLLVCYGVCVALVHRARSRNSSTRSRP